MYPKCINFWETDTFKCCSFFCFVDITMMPNMNFFAQVLLRKKVSALCMFQRFARMKVATTTKYERKLLERP